MESRSIVHRMLASDREHERDVYFGRQGYIEGADKNKFNTDEDDWRKKKLPTEKESSKTKIRWFHEDNEDGTVPSSLHTDEIRKSTTKKELHEKEKRAKIVVIDDNDGETTTLVAFTSDPTKPDTALDKDLDQVQEKSPTREEVAEPTEKNGNTTDDCAAELTESDRIDSNKKNEHALSKEEKTVENEDDIMSKSESEMSDVSIGDDVEENEEESESDDESNDERDTSAESCSDDFSGKDTGKKRWKSKSGKKISGVDKKGGSSESGDAEESDGGSESERRVKYKKKKLDQNFTEDSDESSSSSENEQRVEPTATVETKKEQPVVQKKQKKQIGRPKKKGKIALENEELSDIPTPSEDSLTSSSDDSDGSVDPYSFVFKEGSFVLI